MISISPTQYRTFSSLEACAFESPADAGSYWQGIPHHTFVATLRDQLTKKQWPWRTVTHVVQGKRDEVLVACYCVVIPNLDVPKDFELCITVVTANNRRERTRCYFGARDRTTGRGFVGAPVFSFPRLTKGLDLEAAFEAMLAHLDAYAPAVCEITAALVNSKVSRERADHLLCCAAEQGLIAWNKLPDARTAFVNGRTGYRGTSWSLLHGAWEALLRSPVLLQLRALENLQAWLPCVEEET